MADLSAIFKAYDVRGMVPDQLDEPTARLIGAAFALEIGAVPGSVPRNPGVGHDSSETFEAPARGVVVGHDMRASSPGLAAAFSDGVRETGADVMLIGLAATDQLYFASGDLGMPGAMITASHNPAGYNGIKLCRAHAVAMAEDTGLRAIHDRVAGWAELQTVEHSPAGENLSKPLLSLLRGPRGTEGTLEHRDVLDDYAKHLHRLVSVCGRRLRVVVDAGSGMAGHTVPAVFAKLDVELVPMYFELDGNFPHHLADPLDAATLVDLQRAVVERGADLGLAFDGDADRCFAVDECGEVISPSALTALIALRMLVQEPGAHIIHNLITSRAVPEVVIRHGGIPVRTRVGHSLIKASMASTDAVFGGEHSGHFYFRDFWYADSGMLAALHLLAAAAETSTPVSELVRELIPYVASGEVNSLVADTSEVIDKVRQSYSGHNGIQRDSLDGLTVSSARWWFNVRASNTEPVLRLNVEADNTETMVDIRDQVLALMREKS
ncbi:MAG: phosphomannomutase/phosphoglucomutase [Nocardioidaceae bacterium]